MANGTASRSRHGFATEITERNTATGFLTPRRKDAKSDSEISVSLSGFAPLRENGDEDGRSVNSVYSVVDSAFAGTARRLQREIHALSRRGNRVPSFPNRTIPNPKSPGSRPRHLAHLPRPRRPPHRPRPPRLPQPQRRTAVSRQPVLSQARPELRRRVEGPSALSSAPEDATLAALGDILARAAGLAVAAKLK